MNIVNTCAVWVSVFLLEGTVTAQTLAESFLSQLPSIPKNVCNADTSIINCFMAQIDKVKNGINDEEDKLGIQATVNWKKNKDKMLSNNAANLGLNTSDIQKLMNENISEKEGLAVVNKSVENCYGTSIKEFQKVANMSEAEQEQWAKDFAHKQMQKAQQNPEATAKKAEKNKHLYDLEVEQKAIIKRLSVIWEKTVEAGNNYLYQDSVQSKSLQQKLEPLEKDPVLLGGCATNAELQRARALEKQIYCLKLQHCEKMSPVLLDYILQYQTALKMALPNNRRLIEIANELSKTQNGVKTIPIEFAGIDIVSGYTDLLSEAYKYWIPKNTH